MTGILTRHKTPQSAIDHEIAGLAFESLVDGILIYNAENVVIQVNQSFKHFTGAFGVEVHEGMTRRELIGAFIDTGEWETGEFTKGQLIDQQISVRKDLTGNDTEEINPPNGRHYLRRTRRLESGGEIIIITDITSIKKAERKAVREREKAVLAARAKSVFIANMSHELRTPLNGILGMAQVLEAGQLDDRQKKFVGIIKDSGESLLAIINDILDFSKINARKFQLDIQSVNVKAVLEDVFNLCEIMAFEKKIDLMLQIQEDLPDYYFADGGRLRQVFLNLVGNAIKFTQVGYVLINLKGQITDDIVTFHVEISDTGIGIPDDKHSNIFEPFTQVDGSKTRQHGGTGLGLNIVSNIIKEMGGTISLSSKVGTGTTFYLAFSLPVDFEAGAKQISEGESSNKVCYKDFAKRIA